MSKFYSYVLVLLSIEQIFCEEYPKIENPVVLFHGIGGSQIEARLLSDVDCRKASNEPFLLWLNAFFFTPWTLACFAKLIKFENNDGHFTPPKNLESRIPGFGKTLSVEVVGPLLAFGPGQYMKSLVDHLARSGLKRDRSIRAAPYDFRLGIHQLDGYFAQTKELIEETYMINGKKKVNLLCHSLGCLRSIHFLNLQSQEWRDQHINEYITLSAPWLGSTRSILALIEGDNFGAGFLNKRLFRTAQRTFPSLIELLPKTEYFGDKTLLKTSERNYSAHDYEDMFSLFECEECFANYKDMVQANISFPMVNVTCAYSTELTATKYFEYQPDHELRMVEEDGDGVVNLNSLEHCKSWENISPKHRIHFLSIPKVRHSELVTNRKVVREIFKAIS